MQLVKRDYEVTHANKVAEIAITQQNQRKHNYIKILAIVDGLARMEFEFSNLQIRFSNIEQKLIQAYLKIG